MKELTLEQSQQVSGGDFMELATIVSGSALGAATAIVLFPAVQVAWLGIIPLSLPLAGGFIGGSIGQTIYNIELYTSSMVKSPCNA